MIPSSPTITCDPDAKALYIRFSDSNVRETIELAGNVYLDMDDEGGLSGSKS